jgi:DNA repair photolyase
VQPRLFDEPPSFPATRGAAGGAFVPLAELAPAAVVSKRGIARLAESAPEIDLRNEVEYRDLPCRSVISPCDSRRVPFDFTINPYRGCEFGCVYCYARYTHEYLDLQTFRDFERKIFVKKDLRAALLRDLRRRDYGGAWIALGTATDPYQPAERRYRLTRTVLEVFAERAGMRLSITTKSDLVVRDLDLLQRIGERNEVHVNVTITTPHHELSRRTEPRAPRPDKRFAAVRALRAGGVATGVFLMPLLPRINDGAEDLDLLIRQAGEADASYLAASVLFLRQCSRPTFFAFIRERFPDLAYYYQRLYSSDRAESLAAYTRDKLAEVSALKRRHGVPSWPSERPPIPPSPSLPL